MRQPIDVPPSLLNAFFHFTPLPHNHHTAVHVHEGFFFTLPPCLHQNYLPAFYEFVSISLGSSVCTLSITIYLALFTQLSHSKDCKPLVAETIFFL